MSELKPVGDALRGVVSRSGFSVARTLDPKPCEECGVPQHPIVFPELGMAISRPPVCEVCRDRAEVVQLLRDEAHRRANIERELVACGVPEDYVRWSFASVDWPGATKEAAEECLAFALHPEGAIILVGKTGRGKTHLAVAMLREMVIRGTKARFVSCLEMATALRAVYRAKRHGDEDQTEADVISQAGLGVVVLDDLGAGRSTAMITDALTAIVDRCERRPQPLIVTTNLTLADIGGQLDERLASRLAGMCRTSTGERVITIEGPDFRVTRRRR